MRVGVFKVAMGSPHDVSGLRALIDAGTLDPQRIVAVIGKTEGNGGANDFTRGFATLSCQLLLSTYLGVGPEEIGRRIAFIWSGGTEGVLSPHATIFTREPMRSADGQPRLTMGLAATRSLAPEQIGTLEHVRVTADAVRRAMAEAGLTDPASVHFVQVKGPLLTPGAIGDASRRGAPLVTRDPNGSKVFARGAMALGVAVALGEVAEGDVTNESIGRDMSLFSRVASTSAGGELSACEVLLFGNSPAASSDFAIGHAVLQDVVDAAGVRAALIDAGLPADLVETPHCRDRIVSVFAKAEASPDGHIRGRRHTMLSDADIHYERHARAALGAVITSITHDSAVFVSGGTEHQCPPGEAPIAAIIRV